MAAQTSNYVIDALSIPEVLEAIFLGLDMTTLLVSASRVNKTWYSVITSSPAVQQALYFRPIPTTTSTKSAHSLEAGQRLDSNPIWDEEEKAWPVLNPLLAKKFEGCFFDFGGEYGYVRRAKSFYYLPWTATARKPVVEERGLLRNVFDPAQLDEQTARDEDIARRRFTRNGASWRRMLVSQPPPQKLGYLWMELGDINVDLMREAQTVSMALVAPDTYTPFLGLRMGELYDIIQYHAGHHERHSLWFRVLWNQPRIPFVSTFSKETCEEMLAQTSVVVELYHYDDGVCANHDRDPPNVGNFDATFRCDEYCQVHVTSSEITTDRAEFPGWSIGGSVF